MIKVCQYKAGPGQGERLVQLFQPGDMQGAADFFSMGKTASPILPEVQQYLDGLKRHPNKIYVLVNALGAGEYWGSNINGDYFPEPALIHRGRDWGYESFYDAYPYKHHVNKDPSKSFGKVELAVWHDGMKRVELVVAIDRLLAKQFAAEDVLDKLDRGMFPDVSMGCKVPYDLCSICTDWTSYRRAQSTFDPRQHKTVGQAVLAWHKKQPIRGLSVTRNDYCEHLQGMLNKILADGRKVYAINDYPRFFDISFVFIGADKTAKVMAKLASAGWQGDIIPSWYIAEQLGYNDEEPRGRSMVGWTPALEKAASVDSVRTLMAKKAAQKRAEIIKEVKPSQFGGKAVSSEDHLHPDLPTDVLDQLGHCPLHEALSTPSTMGMVLKPREFQRIVIVHIGKKPLADELDRHNQVFGPTEEASQLAPVGGEHFSDIIKKLLLPFLEDRSILEPVAKRRVMKITITKGGPAKPAAEEVNDPFLQKVSSAYNGYLNRLGACLNCAPERITEDTELWQAVHHDGLPGGFEKIGAGAKVDPVIVLGSMGAALLASQFAKNRREQAMMGGNRGEPVSPVTSFVADNPAILSLVAGLLALHQQGSDIPKHIWEGLKGAGRGLIGK